MRPNEYQNLAKGTALPGAWSLSYLIPGIAGETGELVEKIEEGDKDLVAHELADHYWFIAMICEVMDWSIEGLLGQSPASYQKEAEDFAETHSVDKLKDQLVIHVGNMNSAFAKSVRDNGGNLNEKRLRQICLSSADVMLYVGAIGWRYGFTVEELMKKNIDKLYDGKDRGVLGGDGDKR